MSLTRRTSRSELVAACAIGLGGGGTCARSALAVRRSRARSAHVCAVVVAGRVDGGAGGRSGLKS